jgi:radial spoke head protein 4/6
LLNVLNLI